jgi:hypothetical protein
MTGGNGSPRTVTQGSTSTLLTLTAGSHTFSMVYRNSTTTAVDYSNRTITVIPLN